MKKIYLFSILILIVAFTLNAQPNYPKQNINLLGHWFNPLQVGEPTYGIKYNSVWGWVDTLSGNTEYAILGSGTGTHFIDVSNPTNPIERDFVAGKRNLTIWREYKTYGKYLYAISDDGAPNSFQIIDMSYLPDSVHVVYDGTSIFERAHTLYIDGDKLYCGSVNLPGGAGYYGMAVFSLANPELPSLLRILETDYPLINFAHDMLVRNDTVYASCGYQGLFIYKYNTGSNTFSAINTLTSYPDQGYNHSSAITPDGKTLIFCDEAPENLAVKICDLTDITNIPTPVLFKSNEGATPHNPYIYGTNRAVIAYYQDGLQIFDISNPLLPVRTGFFDTDTLHGLNDGFPTTPTYEGAWGSYIKLPSGNILSSDMQNGLYILDATLALGIPESNVTVNNIGVYPNPANANLSVSLILKNNAALIFEIFDVTGRKILSEEENINAGNNLKSMNLSHLSIGIYILKITGQDIHYSEKIVME